MKNVVFWQLPPNSTSVNNGWGRLSAAGLEWKLKFCEVPGDVISPSNSSLLSAGLLWGRILFDTCCKFSSGSLSSFFPLSSVSSFWNYNTVDGCVNIMKTAIWWAQHIFISEDVINGDAFVVVWLLAYYQVLVVNIYVLHYSPSFSQDLLIIAVCFY